MEDFPTQEITIYHKNKEKWERFIVEASYRNTSILNHNRTGSDSIDNVLIRIFNIEEYNLTWFAEKGDIIVNKAVYDEIISTPLTELSKKYGSSNVHKITSTDKSIFDDDDIKELNHIKLVCV
jgi:hypothetical protein